MCPGKKVSLTIQKKDESEKKHKAFGTIKFKGTVYFTERDIRE